MRFAKHLAALVLFALALPLLAQDAHEALGPKDSKRKARGPHPLVELMKSRTSGLKSELRGVHPRVFFTASEIEALKQRSRTTHKELWRRTLSNVRAMKTDPPPPPAQVRRSHNTVGLAIAEAAFIYKIEGDKRYFDAAKKWMDAAVGYDIWGYAWSKPNVDLGAGHLLYGLGIAYDLLYDELTPAERERYRNKLAKQAQILADWYKPKPGRSYSYSQNHVFIPMAGLAVAAYALYDEVPQAPEWAALVRAIYDRVLATYSPDGYYYEGFEYWVFSTPWIIHYLNAHQHSTGEDLFDQPGLRSTHLYVAHTLVPGAQDIFDFGDVGEGSITRSKKGEEYTRAFPGGRLHSNYNILYVLAARYKSEEVQGVAKFMEAANHISYYDWWSLAWFDDKLAAKPIDKLRPWHHFTDHDVVYWRSGWDAKATAFAFKAGPPEGHHTAEKLKKFSDWHLSAGHSHPDANSFIIWAKGRYLTGDSGYAGVPKAEQHNTILIDGKGQGIEDRGHDPWRDVSYDELNKVRIVEAQLGPSFAHVAGEAAGAYQSSLGVAKFRRHLVFVAPDQFIVWDDVAAEKRRSFTAMFHSDTPVKSESCGFRLGEALCLRIPVTASSKIEPNIVVSQGAPGSVDKGQQQHRGERVAVTTEAAAFTNAYVLTIDDKRTDNTAASGAN